MKAQYLHTFKDKTTNELLDIINNPIQHNDFAIAAAHELLRKKTATYTEYQELTQGNTRSVLKSNTEKEERNIFLEVLKWTGIILFFPMSLVVVGYYKNKKAKKEYYANNRPLSER